LLHLRLLHLRLLLVLYRRYPQQNLLLSSSGHCHQPNACADSRSRMIAAALLYLPPLRGVFPLPLPILLRCLLLRELVSCRGQQTL
jgi:hypothetical protein